MCLTNSASERSRHSGRIDFTEFEDMLKRIRRLFPTSQLHIEKVRDVFEKYDADKDGAIGLNELTSMFAKISGRLTALPAVSCVSSTSRWLSD